MTSTDRPADVLRAAATVLRDCAVSIEDWQDATRNRGMRLSPAVAASLAEWLEQSAVAIIKCQARFEDGLVVLDWDGHPAPDWTAALATAVAVLAAATGTEGTQ